MENKKLESILKYAVAGTAIVVGGLAAAVIVKGVVALTILAVGGLALVNGAPVLAQWAAQMKLKGIKYNARKNPVEDLQLLYSKKNDDIQKGSEAITAFNTEVKQYKSKLDEFKSRRPERAAEFQTTYDNMLKVYQIRTLRLKAAQEKLKDFEQVIIEANDIWDMTQAAIKANRAMKNFEEPNVIDEIRQRTALDSVTSSLNQVMAELETSLSLDYNALDAHVSKPTLVEYQPAPNANFIQEPVLIQQRK